MSHANDDRVRLIRITDGNIQHAHLYLTGMGDFFPREAYGAPNRNDGLGKAITLHVEGLPEPVETDIAPRRGAKTGARFFRKRAWVAPFLRKHGLQPGDMVAVQKVTRLNYRIYPVRDGSAGPRHRKGTLGMLFPVGDVDLADSTNGARNRVQPEDTGIHDWYRFVLSFPPHLVRECLERFGIGPRHRVLDPFCGTGTTVVECKKLGIPSTGVEAHPMAAFAARTKINWSPSPRTLRRHARRVAELAGEQLASHGISDLEDCSRGLREGSLLRTLPPDRMSLLLTNSISPIPLHKALVLLDTLKQYKDDRLLAHEMVALARSLVHSSSNLHFGPEVGVRKPRSDARVIEPWLDCVDRIAADLRAVRYGKETAAEVQLGDARDVAQIIPPNSIDAVITSPPYPNEKDYTRTTRLETVLLGFVTNKRERRAIKKGLVRSNTRGVYKTDNDDTWIAANRRIQELARSIEARRLELRKTSGFERLYARVTKLYFGGMARHFASLRKVLRPGAKLAYVVGDQASYLRVMIRTGQVLSEIAKSLGYEVIGLDLFRTRLATATRKQLREELVLLRWPGEEP